MVTRYEVYRTDKNADPRDNGWLARFKHCSDAEMFLIELQRCEEGEYDLGLIIREVYDD